MNAERRNIKDSDGVLVKRLSPKKGFWDVRPSKYSVAIDTDRGVVHLRGNFRTNGGAHRTGKKFAN